MTIDTVDSVDDKELVVAIGVKQFVPVFDRPKFVDLSVKESVDHDSSDKLIVVLCDCQWQHVLVAVGVKECEVTVNWKKLVVAVDDEELVVDVDSEELAADVDSEDLVVLLLAMSW